MMEVAFYLLVGFLVFVLVAIAARWLYDFFREAEQHQKVERVKRRRKKLPRIFWPLVSFFSIFSVAYDIAWFYTLDPDFTVWTSEVRGYVCIFGGFPALLVSCIIYLEIGRPRF